MSDETNAPTPEPLADGAAPSTETASAAPAETNEAPVTAADLAAFAEASLKGRLSNADEDRATRIMRELILAGDAGPALEAMTKLPWILGVRAAEQAWPTLSDAAHAQLIEGLVKLEGDNAARLRLSLARSLAKIELATGLQLAAITCRGLFDAEKGALSPEHSKLIGNVFIGRGKPWVLQLPLDGLDSADAVPIASCVVFSAFNVNNPPITQLSILRYSAERLGALHENLIAMIAKSVSRWNGKWQSSLRSEIADLPAAIIAALNEKKEPETRNNRNERNERAPRNEAPAEDAHDDEPEPTLPPELEEKLKIATESGDADLVAQVSQEINAWREAHRATQQHSEDHEQESKSETEQGGRRSRGRDRKDRGEKKERPAYVSREQEAAAKQGGSFNFSNAVRQLENYVQGLRNELANTQAKLKRGESGRRTGVVLSHEEASLSPEELKRLVIQLEQRNAELKARVEELLADSETRALSMAAGTDAPPPDALTQLLTLLTLKLQDDYSDYIALESRSTDLIVQQHYRGLIRNVFSTLRAEGIALSGELPPPPPEPPAPLPPPPVDLDDEEEDEDLDIVEDAEPVEESETVEGEEIEEHTGEVPDEPEAPEEPVSKDEESRDARDS